MRTFPSGTVIPAGTWEFQFWTDDGGGTAQLALEFGYCSRDCAERAPLIAPGSGWTPSVTPGAMGAADAHGAFTTTSSTTLPAGGPYRLYWTLKVVKAGAFNLLYDAVPAPSNLATPMVLPVSSSCL